MYVRILLSVLFLGAVAGCSVYDVVALSADAALNLFTDVNEGKEPNDDNQLRFWDPDVSNCIKVETELRGISAQLDAIEQGKEFVVLPTGEKYPVGDRVSSDEQLPGPTMECLSRDSD